MINNINKPENYAVSNTGISQEEVQNTLTKSTQAVSDSFENNSAGKVLSGNTNDPDVTKKTLLLLPFVMLGDGLVNKAIGGKGDGLLGKAASLGDKISNTFHLDKIFSSENESKFSNFIKNNRFTKYFTNDYKAIPKSSFAKSQTMSQKYSQEIIDNLLNLEKKPELAHLFKYGEEGALSPETLNTFYKIGSSNASKTTTTELIKAVDDVMDKGVTSVPKGKFGKTDFSELKNKLKASDMQMGKTKIGSAFAKGSLKTKDLLTYGGGLMSLAFAANAIVQATKATKEAPKGEKKSTFMHVLSENYIGIALFQPSINLLYKLGGNKYRGMDIEGRNALKDLVAKTNADKTLTKEGYKIAKLQKDLLLKGVSKDKVAELGGKGLNEAKTLAKSLKKEGSKLKLWEKPLKAAGKVLDTGLDSIKSPTKLGKATGKLKGFTAGFGRFAIIFLVLQPLLQKPITKLCHKIFGKPETYLAKQEAANNTNNAKETTAQTGNPQNDLSSKETNLVNKWTQVPEQVMGQVTEASHIKTPETKSNTNVNSTEQVNTSSQVSEIPASSLGSVNTDDSQPLPPQKNEEISAFKLSEKQSEEKRYIPRTDNVEQHAEYNDDEITNEVNDLMKSTKSLEKRVKNNLKN